MRITSLEGDSLARTAPTHQLEQGVGFLPLTFFHSLVNSRSKRSWLVVCARPVNAGKLSGLQCPFVGWLGSNAKGWMGHRDWTSYDGCWVLLNHQSPPTASPGHPGLTAWMWRCSDSSHQDAVPSWLEEHVHFLVISPIQQQDQSHLKLAKRKQVNKVERNHENAMVWWCANPSAEIAWWLLGVRVKD